MPYYAVYVLNGVRIPARDVDRDNARKQLHAAVKEALGLMREGEEAEVFLYDSMPFPGAIRLLYEEHKFTRVGRHPRVDPGIGDPDWLLPFLTPDTDERRLYHE